MKAEAGGSCVMHADLICEGACNGAPFSNSSLIGIFQSRSSPDWEDAGLIGGTNDPIDIFTVLPGETLAGRLGQQQCDPGMQTLHLYWGVILGGLLMPAPPPLEPPPVLSLFWTIP
jgi:hypothetical protein